MNEKIKRIIVYIIYSILIIFVIICLTVVFAMKDFFKQNSIIPSINEYSSVINKYVNQYNDKISFFPNNIPNKINDYYCIFEDSFDGYNIHYLKFKTNEKYIQDTINKNKDDISKKIEFKNIDSYYKYIDNHFNIEDKDNASVYILKNKNNDEDYTSGIITSKSGEIVFFYANFDLKQ